MIEKRKFLAQPIENPKRQLTNGNSRSSNSHIEQAKSTITLRCDKVVDNKVQEVPQEPEDNLEEQLEFVHREGN